MNASDAVPPAGMVVRDRRSIALLGVSMADQGMVADGIWSPDTIGVNNMNVQTTRFGVVNLDEKRIITFPAGLLGFSSYKSFALLQPDDEGVFFWLQSLEAPELAFVVTDPTIWIPEYEATIRREQMDELALDKLANAQVFVIVNKYGEALTANLQGPLVINLLNQKAVQLVLADKRWTTRHEIVRIAEPAHAVSA